MAASRFLPYIAAFAISVSVYGAEAFDGDAGARVAVLIEGVFAGLFLGACGIGLAVFLDFRVPWLRA